MKSEILRMLKETDGYISGQELCGHFNVSRTAVWKVIKQLETEGYLIEAVRNKGYKLKTAMDILSRAELESSMNTRWAGRTVIYFEETDSTNTEAKQAAESGALHGTLVAADYQNSGKGRRGRGWSSPHGTGLWMSLILRPKIQPVSASMLTLVAALAVAKAIEEESGVGALIKWPNDIVANGRKLCGILTEMSTDMDCINYVVVGIGINVNMEEFPGEIRDVASSIYLESGKQVKRSLLAGSVMKAFEGYYEAFLKSENMEKLLSEYNDRLANKDRFVKVLAPLNEHTGTALGIDKEGQLLVRLEDGTVEKVVSGEVSVRGIYGYV